MAVCLKICYHKIFIMNLSYLSAFVHVAKTGSMSQSATQLGLSQSALSRHIASLEETLGHELIDRTHRPMRLTDVGEFFYKHAQKNINELNELIALTKNFGTADPNTLTIGFVASILYGFLPEIISQLKSKLPHLEVRLLEVSSNEQMDALKTGKIDVGFGRFLSPDGLVRQVFLRHERIVVALPITHPLAQESAIDLKSLMNDTLILYHRTPLMVGQIDLDPLLKLFYERQLNAPNTQKSRDIQIALGLVAAGEGITLVPESLTSVRTTQICYRPLSPDGIISPIYLSMLVTNQNPHIEALLTAIYEVYNDKSVTTRLG